MVLTRLVSSAYHDDPNGDRSCTRRSLFRAAAGSALTVSVPAALTGCDLLDRAPVPEPTPDPLAAFLNDTVNLANRYESTIIAHPELAKPLTPVAAAYREHATELARITGVALPSASAPAATTSPTGGSPATPPDTAAALAELRQAQQRAYAAAAQACQVAPAQRAALLGSIAAARASQLEVLG